MVREGSLRRGHECKYLRCEKKPVMEETGNSILSEGMAIPRDIKTLGLFLKGKKLRAAQSSQWVKAGIF